MAFERERVVRAAPAAALLCPACLRPTEWLTTRQAAVLIQVCAESVRRWLAEGRAHGVRTPGGRHRVCRASLLRPTQQPAGPAHQDGCGPAHSEARSHALLEYEDV